MGDRNFRDYDIQKERLKPFLSQSRRIKPACLAISEETVRQSSDSMSASP